MTAIAIKMTTIIKASVDMIKAGWREVRSPRRVPSFGGLGTRLEFISRCLLFHVDAKGHPDPTDRDGPNLHYIHEAQNSSEKVPFRSKNRCGGLALNGGGAGRCVGISRREDNA
jgi:hypothetical protein